MIIVNSTRLFKAFAAAVFLLSIDPNEPYLEKNNLPWFYFIPNPEIVPEQLRDKYIIESEKLWGKEHWKDID